MKQKDLKITNRLNVLRELYNFPKSRIELSKKLGLCKATLTQIVEQLLSEGLVKEIGVGESRESGGKKPIICAINHDYGLLLVMHFNAISFQIALADLCGNILESQQYEITVFADYRKTFDLMLDQINEFMERHSSLAGERTLLAFGIAVPGLVDSVRGILQYSSIETAWHNVPIQEYFEKRLKVKTFVEHDARTLNYIDKYAVKDTNNDIYSSIYIGSGVSTGVIIGNTVLHGAHYGAVNFPHTIQDPLGPICRCGKRGCWEALVSTASLAKRIAVDYGHEKGMSFEEAILLYQGGNPKVREIIFDHYAYWMGVGISNFITTFNPQKLTVYGDKRLFDQSVQARILETVYKLTNSVAIKSEIIFVTDIDYVYMNSTIGVVLHRFLSIESHEYFLDVKRNDNTEASIK